MAEVGSDHTKLQTPPLKSSAKEDGLDHNESGVDCGGISPAKLGAGEEADFSGEDISHMKKDDSGIDISRSPTSGKDILSDNSLSDSGAGSRTNSVSEASVSCGAGSRMNTSEAASAQKLSSDGDKTCVAKMENMDTNESNQACSQNVSSSPVSSADSDDSDCGQSSRVRILRETIRRRFRDKRHNVLDSDDTDSDVENISNQENVKTNEHSGEDNSDDEDNDTDDDDDDSNDDDEDDDNDDGQSSVKKAKSSDDKKEDSDTDEENMVDMSKKPKQIWRALFDCRDREYGFNSRVPQASFREKVQGSLQMVQRFDLQYKMKYHEGCVNALHFNRIGTLLASGSDDLNIVLWNWIRNRPALVYDSGHRSNVFQAKFMPFSGDCHVVSCARDGQVRLAELSLTGICKQTKKLAQHKGGAHKLALELDSPHVFLSCGEDAIVYEIDLREDKANKLVLTKEGEKKVPLYSIHSNPANSMEFCVGGRDHYIRVYDKRKINSNINEDGGLLKKFCPHHLVSSGVKANVTCAVYNYNGTEIVGSYNDEDIYLFDNFHSTGAEHIHRYKGHRNNATVKGINFYGPRSEFIVSGSDCGHIFLWDKESEQIVQFMEGDEGGVINVLEPHPLAPILATSGLDHDVKIWAPTSEEPTKLEQLKKTMKKNRKERKEEMDIEPDMIDSQMLWYIMHHIRHAQRRADPDGTGQGSSSSDDSDTEDSDENAPYRMSCNPS